MKKRLMALILGILLLFSLSIPALAVDGRLPPEEGEDIPEESAEPEWIQISTYEDLSLLGTSPEGYYILTDDIDMADRSWTPIAFRGSLDGNGHAIYNLSVTRTGAANAETVDGNDMTYKSVFSGLFSTLENAEIFDLELRGVSISVITENNCYIGALAGFMKDTRIENCSVSDARLSLTAKAGHVGVGGLVGFGCGELRNCKTDVVLLFKDQNTTRRCEQFMGGLVASGNIIATGCGVTIDGYNACNGYVHNGGLMGMFYAYDPERPAGSVTNCSVNGMITFYENNPDRRAYCQAFIGEALTGVYPNGCTDSFTPNEVFDYSLELKPESCESPVYEDSVITPDCNTWGCTVHTCTTCGQSWKDSFIPPVHQEGSWHTVQEASMTEPGRKELTCSLCGKVMKAEEIPAHVPGAWVTVEEATYEKEGKREHYCSDCGILLETDVIPRLVPVSGCNLSARELTLYYKDYGFLSVQVLPTNASNSAVRWFSSDESVVTVNSEGNIFAVGRGHATVSCRSVDGFSSSECQVTVTYTPKQWLIMILGFGWLWY